MSIYILIFKSHIFSICRSGTPKRHSLSCDKIKKRKKKTADPVAEQQELTLQHFNKESFHIVVMDTLSAVALADETACAELDVLVNDIDDLNILWCCILHTIEERSGYMHCVTFFTLGAAVENKYFHDEFSPSRSIKILVVLLIILL